MSILSPRDLPTARLPFALLFVGAVATGVGVYAAPERTWLNLLVSGFYLLSLAMSAAFFLATQFMSGARWSAGLRRIPESFMLLLVPSAVLMLAVFLGRRFIYPWSIAGGLEHEAVTAGRATYLTAPMVLGRTGAAFGCWAFFVWMFRRTSLEQDVDPSLGLVHHRRLVRWAAAFLLVFAPSFTMASYDWVLSLDTRWFSTMFAIYVFAGALVQGIAAVTLVVVLLRQRGLLGDTVGVSHLHDLGKLLFAFSTFWAYIWLCQYLLIWYGNVPEEVTYYVRRTNGPWLVVFAADVVVNWLVPFVALMSADAKRAHRRLFAIALVLLVGHWLDLYLLVMPSKWERPSFGWLEALIPAASGSLAYFVVSWGLARAPLVPVNDPILASDRARSAHGRA